MESSGFMWTQGWARVEKLPAAGLNAQWRVRDPETALRWCGPSRARSGPVGSRLRLVTPVLCGIIVLVLVEQGVPQDSLLF